MPVHEVVSSVAFEEFWAYHGECSESYYENKAQYSAPLMTGFSWFRV